MKKLLQVALLLAAFNAAHLSAMEEGDNFLKRKQEDDPMDVEVQENKKQKTEQNSVPDKELEKAQAKMTYSILEKINLEKIKPVALKTQDNQLIDLTPKLSALVLRTKLSSGMKSQIKNIVKSLLSDKKYEFKEEQAAALLESVTQDFRDYTENPILVNFAYDDVKPIIEFLENFKDDLRIYEQDPTHENQGHLLIGARLAGNGRYLDEKFGKKYAHIISLSPCVYPVLRILGLDTAIKMIKAFAQGKMPDGLDNLAYDPRFLGVQEYVAQDIQESIYMKRFKEGLQKFYKQGILCPKNITIISGMSTWKFHNAVSADGTFQASIAGKNLIITMHGALIQTKALEDLCGENKVTSTALFKWADNKTLLINIEEQFIKLHASDNFSAVQDVNKWPFPADPNLFAYCTPQAIELRREGREDVITLLEGPIDIAACTACKDLFLPVLWSDDGKYVCVQTPIRRRLIEVATGKFKESTKNNQYFLGFAPHFLGFAPHSEYMFSLIEEVGEVKNTIAFYKLFQDGNISNIDHFKSLPLQDVIKGFEFDYDGHIIVAAPPSMTGVHHYIDFNGEEYFKNIPFLQLLLLNEIQRYVDYKTTVNEYGYPILLEPHRPYALNSYWKEVFDGFPPMIKKYLRYLCVDEKELNQK